MKKAMLIIFGIICLYLVIQLLYSGYFYLQSGKVSSIIYTDEIVLGEKNPEELYFYVGGDSIATGVGASSFETSVVGRVAKELAKQYQVILTNMAENGAKMADIANADPPKEVQDITILIVSSNDLLRFTNLKEFEKQTKKVLENYSKNTEKLIIVGPGRAFDAKAIPLPVRLIYRIQAPKYAEIIAREASKHKNASHVNPINPPVDLSNYDQSSSADGLHPNDEGHRFWTDMIKTVL